MLKRFRDDRGGLAVAADRLMTLWSGEDAESEGVRARLEATTRDEPVWRFARRRLKRAAEHGAAGAVT
jgi:hypothetical protein